MKNLGLVRIFLSGACGVLVACAADDELDRAGDLIDNDDIASVSQALTLPPADRATIFINADDPAFSNSSPQGPAASGLCLDASNAGTGYAQLWSCHGQDNQRWALDTGTKAVDSTSPRAIANSAGNCLEPMANVDGARVRAYVCHGMSNQHWYHTWSGQLRHRSSGKCLDADASSGSIGQGTPLQLWTCHGGGNQKWTFGSTILRSAASGRCLDVHTPNGQPTSVVQIWDCHGNANQQWHRRVSEWNGGLIVGDVNGNCLTASGLANGSAVTFQSCTGPGDQLFSYLADGSMYHQASKRCLDVVGNGQANGTSLQLYDCHGGANQRWTTR